MTAVSIPGHGEIEVPRHLIDNIGTAHGRNLVDAWLAELGPMLRNVLDALDARLVPGDPPLSWHLVLFAVRATGEELVVKCSVPNAEQPPELAAVHALSDAGIGPRLVWDDLDRGVFAMERVLPGDILPTAMPSLGEDADIARGIASLAARIAATTDVARWRGELVPVREYSNALGEVDPASELWARHGEDIALALTLREGMLAAPDRRDILLHGDLHHYNVLRDAQAGYRVIDPKGLVGPAGYEVGAFLYNPVGIQHHPGFAAITRQRLDIWSVVTGLPWRTVHDWGYVAAVLSACWSGRGGGIGWREAMTVATTLRDIAPLS